MTEAEARRLAAKEGLELLTADTQTGFKGVYKNRGTKPFEAKGIRCAASAPSPPLQRRP